jgi:hypothetical protein
MFFRGQMFYKMSGTAVNFAKCPRQLVRSCDAEIYNFEISKGKQ